MEVLDKVKKFFRDGLEVFWPKPKKTSKTNGKASKTNEKRYPADVSTGGGGGRAAAKSKQNQRKTHKQ